MTEAFFGDFDLAQLALYLFWIFFAGLVFYLQRENMREGYPLEEEDGSTSSSQALFGTPEKKVFKMPHGRGELIPEEHPERENLALRQSSPTAGSPLEPTGDPMLDGVGPASWAPRRDVPELDGHGHVKIVPMAHSGKFNVAVGRDPRGLPVQAHDGKVVGSIVDMWVDEPEQLVRYLEIELNDGAGRRLLPMTLARIRGDRVKVHSLYGEQFPNVPTHASPNQVTMLEEEKICGFYCGGKLYADAARQEPQIG
ncbi:photosynthetic reaction center subunit H [Pontivivens ytuae]|uniref:Photosynthetic reaction center subunit H n=1 Tax=Pontivivens ytuae TaxID=2789856 RepID=A0A7S9QC49_9RHOB|nr:photosynthetic reaction center subunit H [Pontivivens ytuae]QPH53450.1 photosynthetic reaction center subunit H [Pontivivens ytuae]